MGGELFLTKNRHHGFAKRNVESRLNMLRAEARHWGALVLTMTMLIFDVIVGMRVPTKANGTPENLIEIDRCRVTKFRSLPPSTGSLEIVFRSKRPPIADEIRFRVAYAGRIEQIVDVGKFSQGVSIDHSFGVFRGSFFFGPTPELCIVDYVHYLDGATWSAP